jgi:hypothetical protein
VTPAGAKPDFARDARWLIDGKPVANGLDAFTTTPRAGMHTLTLELVGDESGSDTIRFRSIAIPSEADPRTKR